MTRPALKLVINNPTDTTHRDTQPFTKENMQERLAKFSKWLLVHRGLKASTIDNYRKIMARVLLDCETLYPTAEDLENAVVRLHNNGASYNHIVNTSISVERYSEFIEDPLKLGRPKKPKRVLKNILTEAEIAVIIAATKNIREKAIIGTLAYSGIRNDELCSLRKSDIDFGNNLLTVIDGKGSKDRVVPISGDCVQLLLEYLAKFPRDDNAFLFTTLRTNRQYTGWALRQLVKAVVKRTKVKKHVHPHLFRHSLASNMLFRGANLLTIQQQLGHSDIATTMMYISPKTNRLIAEYQTYAPSYL